MILCLGHSHPMFLSQQRQQHRVGRFVLGDRDTQEPSGHNEKQTRRRELQGQKKSKLLKTRSKRLFGSSSQARRRPAPHLSTQLVYANPNIYARYHRSLLVTSRGPSYWKVVRQQLKAGQLPLSLWSHDDPTIFHS